MATTIYSKDVFEKDYNIEATVLTDQQYELLYREVDTIINNYTNEKITMVGYDNLPQFQKDRVYTAYRYGMKEMADILFPDQMISDSINDPRVSSVTLGDLTIQKGNTGGFRAEDANNSIIRFLGSLAYQELLRSGLLCQRI